MKILIFLHGTLTMHSAGVGVSRRKRVQQVIDKDRSVHNYSTYVPVGNAVKKLQAWHQQGATIVYLTSHTSKAKTLLDHQVLARYNFPEGGILYRRKGMQYHHLAEQIIPDILIEDDCESIGGESEMTITNVRPEIKTKIHSIVVKEFSGIDHLPDKLEELRTYNL